MNWGLDYHLHGDDIEDNANELVEYFTRKRLKNKIEQNAKLKQAADFKCPRCGFVVHAVFNRDKIEWKAPDVSQCPCCGGTP